MRKEYLTPLFIIIAFVGLSFFGLPKLRTIDKLNQKITALQEQAVKTEAYFAGLSKIEQRLAGLSEAKEMIETALPAKISQPLLFSYFQKIVAENGLLLKGISISVSEKTGGANQAQSASIHLQLLGSYSSFKSFLKALEHAGRLFNITSITIGTAEKEEAKGLLSFGVEMRVYAQTSLDLENLRALPADSQEPVEPFEPAQGE